MANSCLPPPMVAADVDLSKYPSMLLDVARLRDSDFAAVTSGDEFKAGLLLWCYAWHQKPAASLPDDDRILAKHSGSGKNWRQVRDGALRNFVRCSDGRLYHPILAEKALAAWENKIGHSRRTMKATDARVANRANRDDARHVERDDERDDVRDVHQQNRTEQNRKEASPMGFDEFWALYPRKAAKKGALTAWKRLKPNADLVAVLMKALMLRAASADWQRDGGKFIPHPATWLNGRRWEDQHEATSAGPGPMRDTSSTFDDP